MDEAEIRAELDALRARVAALEFAVDIERADERRRAVEWALAYGQAAPPFVVSPTLAQYAEERLRSRVAMAVMLGPKSVTSMLADSPDEYAKGALFDAFADPAESRAIVAWLRNRGATWADYGLPGGAEVSE